MTVAAFVLRQRDLLHARQQARDECDAGSNVMQGAVQHVKVQRRSSRITEALDCKVTHRHYQHLPTWQDHAAGQSSNRRAEPPKRLAEGAGRAQTSARVFCTALLTAGRLAGTVAHVPKASSAITHLKAESSWPQLGRVHSRGVPTQSPCRM